MGDREAAECITARGTPAYRHPTSSRIQSTRKASFPTAAGRETACTMTLPAPPPTPSRTCTERCATAEFVYTRIARGRETRTSRRTLWQPPDLCLLRDTSDETKLVSRTRAPATHPAWEFRGMSIFTVLLSATRIYTPSAPLPCALLSSRLAIRHSVISPPPPHRSVLHLI
ncbi:hypothetical protein C8Q74DRAFT_259046 [Fomes fomentarius]|nr:hypothetical protein C8Q74DRAFT_259046 [Fomes fomentarius]